MDKPNYVLKTNEAILKPSGEAQPLYYIKIIAWIIVGIIVLASLIFRDNIFMAMSPGVRVLLVSLLISTFFIFKKRVDVPSPLEIQFYDYYLVLYRPKVWCSNKLMRREFDKMYYSEITKCAYLSKMHVINFYGDIEGKFYNYNKDGNLSDIPVYDRKVTNTITSFSVRCAEDVDFISEIEEHSPVKVVIENR